MSESRTISRRNLVKVGGALGAAAALSAHGVLGRVEAATPQDPLLDLIATYRAGMADYNADPHAAEDDDEYTDRRIAETWGPSYDALHDAPPARTRHGAIEALRLAHDEMRGNLSPTVEMSLVAAALAFFLSTEGGA